MVLEMVTLTVPVYAALIAPPETLALVDVVALLMKVQLIISVFPAIFNAPPLFTEVFDAKTSLVKLTTSVVLVVKIPPPCNPASFETKKLLEISMEKPLTYIPPPLPAVVEFAELSFIKQSLIV